MVLLLVTLHQLRGHQLFNKHKGVSDKCMFGSVSRDSNIYIDKYIYCVHVRFTRFMTTLYQLHVHLSKLNIHIYS